MFPRILSLSLASAAGPTEHRENNENLLGLLLPHAPHSPSASTALPTLTSQLASRSMKGERRRGTCPGIGIPKLRLSSTGDSARDYLSSLPIRIGMLPWGATHMAARAFETHEPVPGASFPRIFLFWEQGQRCRGSTSHTRAALLTTVRTRVGGLVL